MYQKQPSKSKGNEMPGICEKIVQVKELDGGDR